MTDSTQQARPAIDAMKRAGHPRGSVSFIDDDSASTVELTTEETAAIAAAGPAVDHPVIKGYAVRHLIGRGGCAEVYLAEHVATARQVAIKVLSFEMSRVPKMHDRFEREIMAVRLIGHPHIVEIYDNGRLADGRPYYAMELLAGKTIRELLSASGRLCCEDALAILEPVSAAVSAAHRAGVVHRDIKANNVVVDDSSGKLVVKLLDFGIAGMEMPGSRLTTIGRVLGTPTSMAPEQIRGLPADERTDIYALGVLLYQLVTGGPPFVGPDSVEVQHLQRPAPRPSRVAPVPPSVDDVVLRCMEKDRERRYASVDGFLDALRRAICGTSQARVAPERQSIALYIDLTINAEGAPEDLAWDIVTAFDDVERLVADDGFAIPIRTATMLLGVQVLPQDAEAARAATQRVLDLAHELHHQLTLRTRAVPITGLRACVHVDRAAREVSATGLDDWSGPLLEIGRWVPEGPVAHGERVAATASAWALLGSSRASGERAERSAGIARW
jgi:serine/threonine-protein kinase